MSAQPAKIEEKYKTNLEKNMNKVRDFKLDLDENVNKMKELSNKYSRKEINLNFIDVISRKVYMNSNHMIKVEFAQYMIFIILLYYYNPLDINTKFPALTKLLVLVVSFIYVVLFFFVKMKVEAAEDVDLINPTEKNIMVQFFSIIIFFVLFMLTINGILWLLINTSIMQFFRHMMSIFIFFGVLGVVYLFTKKQIDKAKNAQGKSFMKFMLKLLLYIPCLMADIAEYVKYEFHLTTKPVWILMAIEGGLIALWVIIPYLFSKIMTMSGIKLLNEPEELNKETTLGMYEDLNKNPNDKQVSIDELYSQKVNEKARTEIEQQPSGSLDNAEEKQLSRNDPNAPKNKYLLWLYLKMKRMTWIKVSFKKHPQYTEYKGERFSYKYGLSAWFYINPQPPSTSSAYGTYTNILNYGKKINIEYNGKLSSLRVMAAVGAKGKKSEVRNESIEIYETKDVIYQKWNNIVINYDNGYIDVFLNGVLVASQAGAVPYMSFDNIVAGAANGIMGGICNVTYYQDTISEKTIRINYRTLRIKEIPYIWNVTDQFNLNFKIKKDKSNDKFGNDMKKLMTGA